MPPLLWIAGFYTLLFAIPTGVLKGTPRYSVRLFWCAIAACFTAQAIDGFDRFWWL